MSVRAAEECLQKIKQDIASVQGCKIETVHLLESLLGEHVPSTISHGPTGGGPEQNGSERKRPALKEKPVKRPRAAAAQRPLPEASRLKLATEVVNLSLKVLTETIRTQSQNKFARPGADPQTKSAPVEQLLASETNVQYVACCASLALTLLRKAQDAKAAEHSYRIEAGMSALIGKLIAVGLNELAAHELSILLRRLTNGELKGNSTSKAPKNEDLSQFLANRDVPNDKQGMSLMVASQLHCLKLLAIWDGTEARAALKRLRSLKQSGPFNSIVCCYEKGYMSPSEASKSFRALSQALSSIANRHIIPHTQTVEKKEKLGPSHILQYQILGLQTLLEANRLLGHETDFANEVLIPLGRHIRAFCRESETSGGSSAADILASVQDIVEKSIQTSLPSEKADLVLLHANNVRASIVVLAKLCAEPSEVDQSFRIAATAFEKVVKHNARDIQGLCELCYNGVEAGVSAKLLNPQLSKLRAALESCPKVPASELDDILVSSSSLRRRVVEIMRQTAVNTTGAKIRGTTQTMDLYQDMLICVVKFMSRYLEGSLDISTARDHSRDKQRVTMINRIARPTIDAVLICFRSISPEESRFQELLKCVTICVSFVDTLEAAVDTKTLSALDERLLGIRNRVSDSLSSSYQSLRGHAQVSGVTIALLQLSVNVLTKHPFRDSKETRYEEKLCRLIRAYDSYNSPSQAYEALQLLAKYCIESGALTKAVRCAETSGDGRSSKSDPSTLHRMATLFMHTRAELPVSTLPKLFESINASIDMVTYGHLAERQMTAIVDMLELAGSTNGKVMMPAIDALNIYYPSNRHPVRRLRVIAWILQVAKFWPKESDSVLVEECEKELVDFDLRNSFEDATLIDQVPYLLALAHVSLATSGLRPRLDLVRSALESWKRILRSADAQLFGFLAKLPLLWLQMSSLAEYLHAHCLFDEYQTCLFVLYNLHEHGIFEGHEIAAMLLLRRARAKTALGYPHASLKLLESTSAIVEMSSTSSRASVECAKALSLLQTGRLPDANVCIGKAIQLFGLPVTSDTTKLAVHEQRLGRALMTTALFGVIADYLEAAGEIAKALLFARASARHATSAWRAVLKKSKSRAAVANDDESHEQSMSEDQSQVKDAEAADELAPVSTDTPSMLDTAIELIESLTRLSSLLADSGLVQDARQYLRQAERVAQALKLEHRSKRLAITAANFDILERRFEDAVPVLEKISSKLGEDGLLKIEVGLALCRAIWEAGDNDKAWQKLASTQLLIDSWTDRNRHAIELDSLAVLGQKLNNLSISSKRTVAGNCQKPSGLVSRKRKDPKSDPIPKSASDETNVQRNRLISQAKLLNISMSLAGHEHSDTEDSLALLRTVPQTVREEINATVLRSKVHFREGMDILALDPIYNSLNDAPLVFPAKIQDTAAATHTADEKPTTRRKRAGTVSKVPKKASKPAAVRALTMPAQSLQAFGESARCLKEIAALARNGASTYVLHDLAYSSAKISMFLSTAQAGTKLDEFSCSLAAAMEIGRGSAELRQSSAASAERTLASHDDKSLLELNHSNEELPLSSSSLALDFRGRYVDILPESWAVVSLSLSEDGQELQISRLRKDATPFVLALPLGRNFDGVSEDDLSFGAAKEELSDIVRLANFSAHDAGDMSKKGAKTEWWSTRKALDERLEILLESMSQMWLGGFAGLFCQRAISPKAFLAFVNRFGKILDAHLPSRSQRNNAAQSQRVNIDQQVMEIFIGLGLPASDGDLDEALLDLLAFVVDILQFHGERNAFDEIDFDAMVLDTLDALGQYHQTAERERDAQPDGSHLILILDKHLHCFPWESLPCMQGIAVSRLPSLEMLRQRILQQRQLGNSLPDQDILAVDHRDGAVILNPAGDLQNTEKTFIEPLANLPDSWSKMIRRAPEEQEVADLLNSRSLYVYLGHGSGGQYIRSRTVRKMENCAVSLLLGCSSATVTEAGQFESYGTPLTYLQGGAPTVVGTLWDVTDKDIDRFSLKMMQRWGLIGSDALGNANVTEKMPMKAQRGRGKKTVKEQPLKQRAVPLDTAVAEARSECLMRFLNGAAPVVYGVPVVLR